MYNIIDHKPLELLLEYYIVLLWNIQFLWIFADG